MTLSFLSRAKASGYSTLVVTVDTMALGWRPLDLDVGFHPFGHGLGIQIALSDPVFMRKHGEDLKNDSGKWIDSSVWHGKAHTWEKIPWLVEQWKRISGGRPFVIKGIQCAADARRARDAGCEGIVVTNHAGRQVDGAVGSIEVLPEIVEAVGDSEFYTRCSGELG